MKINFLTVNVCFPNSTNPSEYQVFYLPNGKWNTFNNHELAQVTGKWNSWDNRYPNNYNFTTGIHYYSTTTKKLLSVPTNKTKFYPR